MSKGEQAFTPPTIESQYWHVHPDHVSPDHLSQMQEQIAESGAYVGEVLKYGGLNGAVEIVVPERQGGLLKVMPDAVMLPHDHPVRKRDETKTPTRRALARAASPFDFDEDAILGLVKDVQPLRFQPSSDFRNFQVIG